MTNDPDLLDKPCPECHGTGQVLSNLGDWDVDCLACNGDGVVLR